MTEGCKLNVFTEEACVKGGQVYVRVLRPLGGPVYATPGGVPGVPASDMVTAEGWTFAADAPARSFVWIEILPAMADNATRRHDT